MYLAYCSLQLCLRNKHIKARNLSLARLAKSTFVFVVPELNRCCSCFLRYLVQTTVDQKCFSNSVPVLTNPSKSANCFNSSDWFASQIPITTKTFSLFSS
eukprot:NODE_320_length_9849_cov_0.608923.p7 type:complete len:100 gc:universal NODE_320_length_9849_cov_0.608923:5608-5309(-)